MSRSSSLKKMLGVFIALLLAATAIIWFTTPDWFRNGLRMYAADELGVNLAAPTFSYTKWRLKRAGTSYEWVSSDCAKRFEDRPIVIADILVKNGERPRARSVRIREDRILVDVPFVMSTRSTEVVQTRTEVVGHCEYNLDTASVIVVEIYRYTGE
jgi:hypothetical protein